MEKYYESYGPEIEEILDTTKQICTALNDFADGKISEDDIERHIENCRDCQAILKALRK